MTNERQKNETAPENTTYSVLRAGSPCGSVAGGPSTPTDDEREREPVGDENEEG